MNDKIRVPLIPECSECIVDSLKVLIPLLTDDSSERYEYFSLAYAKLAKGFRERKEPLELSIELYRELYTQARTEDPYSEIKKRSIAAAEKVLPIIECSISEMKNYQKLRGVLAAGITGNVIDFNTAGHNPDLDALSQVFDQVLEQGFAIDHSKYLWKTLKSKMGRIVVLADNVGETLLDVPLLRFTRELGWNNTYVVKGKAMINDAVRDDVEGTEVEKHANIVDSGAWGHGVPKKWVSNKFMELIRNSDLVISKGQANIESFPEIQEETRIETYYVTKGKCAHISSSIGAKVGDNIVLRKPDPEE
ncbi:MAG: DUF89 domain-containing protein [Candidatus Hodarchaeota archaeon]